MEDEAYILKEEKNEAEEEDSEGVVVQNDSPQTTSPSEAGTDGSTEDLNSIEITVGSFTAAKGAKFLKNKKVHSLYVSLMLSQLTSMKVS